MLNDRFREIGEEIKAKKFYDNITSMVNGLKKPEIREEPLSESAFKQAPAMAVLLHDQKADLGKGLTKLALKPSQKDLFSFQVGYREFIKKKKDTLEEQIIEANQVDEAKKAQLMNELLLGILASGHKPTG